MKTSPIRWRALAGALRWHLHNSAALPPLLLVLALLAGSVLAVRLTIGQWRYEATATSITPITSASDGASGIVVSGSAYEVRCAVTGAVVLYPAVHDGTVWTVYRDRDTCTMDGTGAGSACVFPTRRGDGLWNVFKSGAGSVSSCTAAETTMPVGARRGGSGGGGSGTVTSVGLSLPAIMTVSGSPVTSAGTLAGTLATQTANYVWAGPASGGAAAPTFRALVSADVPAAAVSQLRWHPADRPAQRGITPSYGASAITFGTAWIFTKAGLVVTGIRAYWGGAATVTLKLWLADGSVGASCSASPAGAGITSCTFGTPYTIAAGDVGKLLITSTYDGAHYTYSPGEDLGPYPIATRNAGPMAAGPWVHEVISGTGLSGFYAAGDAVPNYPDTDAFVEPIITDAAP